MIKQVFISVCSLVQLAWTQTVFLELGSVRITEDNTELNITDIGEGLLNPSLACNIDLVGCCGTSANSFPAEITGWYYPDGSIVRNNSFGDGFYSQRVIYSLSRLEGADPYGPTGSYCCVVVASPTAKKSICASLVLCQALPNLVNGNIAYSENDRGLGTVATHSCMVGYTLTGSESRVCEGPDTWSGSAPECQPISCGQLPAISNGSPGVPSSMVLGGTVSYSCNSGYELLGSSMATCQADGNWSDPPYCRATCMLLSSPSSGEISYSPMTPTRDAIENYTATFSCDPGYSLVGAQTLICTNDGSWNGTEPTCTLVCMNLVPPTNGIVIYSPPEPPRMVGTVAVYGCVPGYEVEGTDLRVCGGDVMWNSTAPSCKSILGELLGQNVSDSEDNIVNLTGLVSSVLDKSPSNPHLQSTDTLMSVSQIFGNVATFVSSSNTIINSFVVESMVAALDSVLQWSQMSLLVEYTSSILQSFEEVVSLFAQQRNSSLVLSEIASLTQLGQTSILRQTGSRVDFSTFISDVTASISLPPELFDQVPLNRITIGVFYALYENPSLFPISKNQAQNSGTRKTIVGSPVIAATVGPGIDFTDISPPILIELGLSELSDNITIREGSETCVSWSFSSNSWITDGCETIMTEESVQCQCSHLTNFAVLIDICSRAQDCENDPVSDSILSVITYIGVVLSCIGLFLTVVTLLAFKELRARDNTSYHIQLCVAIFCVLVVFAAGIERTEPYAGCVVVSVLIHYFSLVAVMWMGAEAVLMFQKLVFVFGEISKTYLFVTALICWLIPLLPVLLALIVDMTNGSAPGSDLIVTRTYHNQTGLTTGFCFLKHPGVFFGAFLAPILALLLFNFVIFIWVIVVVLKSTKGKLERANEKLKPKTAIRVMISLIGVMFLFGLTWLFAAFTFTIAGNDVVRIIFQALFVVCAAFQGFFFFIFFCVLDKKARDAWKDVLIMLFCKNKLPLQSSYSLGSSSTTRSNQCTKKTEALTLSQNSLNLQLKLKTDVMRKN